MKIAVPKKPINKKKIQHRWLELLARVKTNEGMMLAVVDADKLLEDVLKKLRFKGKTMGEKLVAAQKQFTNNDSLWYAHKLKNRLVHEPQIRLKKDEAKKALAGFRQALRDLGVL